jgi:phage terminase Nu1 subunit (DNA packaging protein)
MPYKASASRERLAAAQAERAERQNRLEAGELAPIAAVRDEWANIAVQIRTRLLAIPSRIAARHPGNAKLIADLEKEIESALNSLADDDV